MVLEANAVLSSEQPQEGDTVFFFFTFFFFFSHLGMRFKEMFCNCSRL